MARLGVWSGQEVCEILRQHGFAEVRRRGSHIVMQKRSQGSTTTVPVPDHAELRIGTLRAIIRQSELPAVVEQLEQVFALELAHGYLHPIDVDLDVGLLAIVGEGMRGIAGMAGRIFTAISRETVNIIAIAQGSSEITIAIVVRRAGLEKAVRAVHEECGLGR